VDLFSVKHLNRKPTAMTSNQILTADLLDILFEHRNKAYGAYAIRRAYPKNLLKAVRFMLLLVIALCVYVMSQPKKTSGFEQPVRKITEMTLIDEKPPIQKEPEKRTVEAQPPTKVDRHPVIVPDNTIIEHPVVDRTSDSVFVPGSTDSPGTGGDANSYVQGKVSTGTSITTEPPVEAPEPLIRDFADVQPEFPGGVEAWRNYLQKMLRVPDELEPGDRRTVQVKFVVNNNGDVTDAVIIKSAGNMYDREVLRVIARMPKWKPGKQNGQPVAVYFTQPVTFTASEE
jgi:protein TonB